MHSDSASAAVHCVGVDVRPLMAEMPGAAKHPSLGVLLLSTPHCGSSAQHQVMLNIG